MTRRPIMLGAYCPQCGQQHGGEPCGHNAEAPCTKCGRGRGLMSWAVNGTECARCVLDLPDVPLTEPAPVRDVEWWEVV